MTSARVIARALLGKRARHAPQRAASVSIHVRDVAQMFNSLDPSPFWDRDLDREAAEFIEEEFAEKLAAHTWHLHVHAQGGAALAADLQAAVEHYYERLAGSARYRLRNEMRLSQLALLGGVTIFLLSMTIRGILAGMLQGSAPRMLDEGLIIIAWLALWRPVESLVYGWVPEYRRRRLYERLAAVRVSVRIDAAAGAAGAHVGLPSGAAAPTVVPPVL
ncbi:MAG TPA: hypothetical protein VEU78_01780 [Steroidobacteraceae bacterium]|nr:hypothetical protein [Steroidobacteraceae bacterium]